MSPHRQHTAFCLLLLLVLLYRVYWQRQIAQINFDSSNQSINVDDDNDDDDDDEITLFSSLQKPKRPWAQERSKLWVNLVLNKKMLKGKGEFEKIFRMSRNSFAQLHALLGIPFTLIKELT